MATQVGISKNYMFGYSEAVAMQGNRPHRMGNLKCRACKHQLFSIPDAHLKVWIKDVGTIALPACCGDKLCECACWRHGAITFRELLDTP